MAYSTILKPEDYFNTKLYTGNGSAGHAITGVGHQPDWVWMKGRNQAFDQCLYDAVRGVTKLIRTNLTNAEVTQSGVTSFDSDGFTLGSSGETNSNNDTYVAWNWKANGAGSSNSDGDTTATVSVNTTSGFSMVYYNTGGSGTQSMGHGLGSEPDLIITKPTQNSENWYVYNKPVGNTNIMKWNSTNGAASIAVYPYTPTASVFSVSNSAIGGYTGVMSWCFKSIKGFSKYGEYNGNGNADGTFVYTGFKPAYIMIKNSGQDGDQWQINDNRRGFNGAIKTLYTDSSEVETSADAIDLLSNGFKMRNNSGARNNSGIKYQYMCFAEHPFTANVDGGLPTTAR